MHFNYMEIVMRKMPPGAIPLMACLASLFALATVGCTSAARKAAEAAQQAKIQHALDFEEIQNVMSKHAYYFAAGERQRELDDIWAMQAQGLSWGTDDGYWVDAREIEDYYVHHFDPTRAKEPIPTYSDPVIEISGDGYTAQGLWYAMRQVSQTQGGKQILTPVWEQHGVDFYRPNKNWKIFHFFVHKLPSTASGQSPEASSTAEFPVTPAPSLKISTKDRGFGPYATPLGYLKVPHPYYTLGRTFNYGPPDDR